jgi:hypothetical protein
MILRFFLFTFILSTIETSFAQDWNTIGSGAPQPDIALQDHYGYSISIEGNVAVIGAPANDDQNVNAGKVFVYEKSNGQWQLISELSQELADAQIQFGKTVLVKDGIILVGVPGFNGFGLAQEGRVEVYKRNEQGWVWINELKNNFPSAEDHFGTSLAMFNGVVAVGVPGTTDNSMNSGSVLLFENIESESFPVAKVVAPEIETSYKFGMSVALNTNDLFVGDIRSRVNGINRGAVFVFDLDTYLPKAKLTTAADIFYFGSTLAVTDNEVAVSSWGVNSNNSFGAVFMFDKPVGGWVDATENVQLLPANGDEYGIYGSSIYLDDESLIIGSDGGIIVDFFDKPATSWADAANPFQLKEDSFTYLQRYGYSLAVSGTDVIIGAYNWNLPDEYSGAAFTYEKTGAAWNSLTEKEVLKGFSLSASGDKLGFSVDIDGEYAVAGAPYDDTFGESSGAAYVFKFTGTGWDRVAKLTPSDGSEFDYFGWSVAINGNTIVVSAREAAPTNINGAYAAGKVYIFEKNAEEWISSTESAAILRIDNTHRGSFGYDVDIEHDEIVISHFDDGFSHEVGLVYLFGRTTPTWEQKALLSPSETNFTQFGISVVLKNNLIAIGAPRTGNIEGAVLLYERPVTGWVNAIQSAVLRPSDLQTTGFFGASVDIHGNTVLVGAQQFFSGAAGAGYVFEKNGGWKDATEDAILTPEITVEGARYGASVALGHDFAVISSSVINSQRGRAIIFRRVDGRWKNTNEYTQLSSFHDNDRFGFSMAVSNDILVAGAPGASSVAGDESGSAFFYLKQPTITEVNSITEDGTYKVSDKILIKVVFSQPIILTGSAKLNMLLDNDIAHDLLLKNVTDDRELNFEYVVAAGDFSDDLEYTNEDALEITAGQVESKINGALASGALPFPGSQYSLSGLHDFVIDGSVMVGLEDPNTSEVVVYPNPFVDRFSITSLEDASLVLVSANGTQVYKGELRANEVCYPNVQKGIYILEVKTKTGVNKRIKLVKIL